MATTFATAHVPLLWTALLQEFGSTVTYAPQNASPPFSLNVVWKDGAEGEDVWPGSYSVAWVEDADIPAGPLPGDELTGSDGTLYQVDNVQVTPYGYARLVLKEQK
jgi:hypothetical protein